MSCVGPHDFNLGCAVRNLTFFTSDASDGTLCRNLVLRKEYDLSNENVRGLFDREMFPRISFTERMKNAHNTHLYVDRGPRVLNSEGYMYFHLPIVVSNVYRIPYQKLSYFLFSTEMITFLDSFKQKSWYAVEHPIWRMPKIQIYTENYLIRQIP